MLVPDRLRWVAPGDGIRVDAPGTVVERGTVTAEHAHQDVDRERGEIADRGDAVLAQGGRRLRPDAPQARDRERREERRLVAGGDHDEPVRLAQVGRDLGHELRGRDPHGRRQLDLGPDRRLDRPADRGAVSEQRPGTGHVEERLVDRDRLDLVRVAPQQGHDPVADLAVQAAVDGHEHRLRAQRGGRTQRHRRVNAVRPGLVRRRRHDPAVAGTPAPDHDRTAAELGVVALLDRREEGVEVDVEDRSLGHRSYHRPAVRPIATAPEDTR